ncbi:DUF1737 domain-containing protein [Flavobacterium psychrolimnae]|uniref:Uncharacterized protein n=1 Tax=Flavobacterium psychrolimnae TaxID=249351 RepID=A0A366AWU8_9FLAO|nr:DUF1737 domain-containing protein [Flavobacterium psychrolimnae]RBN49349.1 hypothetical protein DR980_13930 [Flavobacterium psychrolimnae]
MNRKIIDYIVVEVRKDPNEYNQHYSPTNKGEALNISLNIKNIENEILIQENKKILSQEVIKYIDKLLNIVEDFSTYKVSESDDLFYQNKYTDLHPLIRITSYAFLDEKEDEYYRVELKKETRKKENEIAAIDKKNERATSEIQKLKIKESAIVENNHNLDFETFRTDFEKSVIYYLKKGYELQGGVSMSKRDSFDFIYCQAMVKYED